MNLGDVPAPEKAIKYAYRLLAARPFSEKEFRARLRDKGYGSAVETVTAQFRNAGYLNDEFFARQQARTLAVNRLWGNYRIMRVLHEKGIDGDLIEDAIALAREELTEQTAIMQILRKKGGGKIMIPEDNKEKQRLIRNLRGRGFKTGLIFEILSVDREEEVDDGQ